MALAAGEYEIGPGAGRLVLRTAREGVAARVGHDLLIEATAWEGLVTQPGDPAAGPSVSVRVDLAALEVVEGTGGVKPLTDADRRQIRRTMHKTLQVDRERYATYTSTTVEIHGASAVVMGDLTLVGVTRPLRLEVRRQGDGILAGTASVVQSVWGIKPYTGFLGTLRLRDAVDVEFTVDIPVG
jgi:polyisoprenoid-binding protein YceI